jgi:hypothetical protein
LLPSAFLTSSAGNLYGESGPIASAELTSLTPRRSSTPLRPNEKWSNGNPSTATTSSAGGCALKALKSVQSDGYRDIKTLTVAQERTRRDRRLHHPLRRVEPALS